MTPSSSSNSKADSKRTLRKHAAYHCRRLSNWISYLMSSFRYRHVDHLTMCANLPSMDTLAPLSTPEFRITFSRKLWLLERLPFFSRCTIYVVLAFLWNTSEHGFYGPVSNNWSNLLKIIFSRLFKITHVYSKLL